MIHQTQRQIMKNIKENTNLCFLSTEKRKFAPQYVIFGVMTYNKEWQGVICVHLVQHTCQRRISIQKQKHSKFYSMYNKPSVSESWLNLTVEYPFGLGVLICLTYPIKSEK